jgi:hypothetical protein
VVRGFGLGALSRCHVGPPCQSMIGVIFCGLLLWVRFAREGQQPYLLDWAQVVSTKFFQEITSLLCSCNIVMAVDKCIYFFMRKYHSASFIDN